MKETIEKFYTAFSQKDAETMASCYHKDIVFWDPGFGELRGEHAGNMWRMLCGSQQGQDFRIEFSDISYANEKGRAKWEAFYRFSKQKRKVHNIIHAEFEFKDGLIIKHTDRFNLHRWSRQAVGITGLLIGWTGFFQKKLQAQTNSMLRKFEAKN